MSDRCFELKLEMRLCIHPFDGCLNPAFLSLPGLFSHPTPCIFNHFGSVYRFESTLSTVPPDVTYAYDAKPAVGNEIHIFGPGE